MSPTFSPAASRIDDAVPCAVDTTLIRHLLKVDGTAPVLLLRALSDTRP